MKNNTSLIIFDMDGLMFDTERLHVSAWKKAGREYGFNIKSEYIFEMIGTFSSDARRLLKSKFNKNFPINEIYKLKEEFIEKYIEKNGIPVKIGLYSLLDYIDSINLQKAIGTSTNRNKTEKYLSLANIKNRFDCIVCGDEIKEKKPMPETFNKISEKTGHRQRKCIVLEDSINGVMASHRAGMRTLFVKDIKELPENMKNMVEEEVYSLHEVKEYLRIH